MEPTAQQYVYALSPVAELLEGVVARTRSVVEAESRQVAELAATELLSVAMAHVPDFPAEFVVAAELPPGQTDIVRHARRLAKEFAASFTREEQ